MTHDQAVALAVIGILVVAYVLRKVLIRVAAYAAVIALYVVGIMHAVGYYKILVGATLPVLFVLWVLIYYDADCWWCKGKGGSSLLGYRRDCWWCGGRRRERRFTARLLGRGTPRQSGPIIAPKTRNRKH